MAKNEVFKDSEGLSLLVPTGTKSGAALRIGILNAVAQTDEGSQTNSNYVFAGVAQPTGGIGNAAGYASVKTTGSWILQVTGATTVTAGVLTPVYITSANALTTTASGNFLFGVALRAKSAPLGPVLVRILQPGQVTANA